MGLRRYMHLPETVWAWPLGNAPLQEARSRYTVIGNPTAGVGPWGPYLTFDGAADYVTLTAAQEWQLRFDSGTQDFSVVAWVRRAATGAYHIIVDKRDGGGDGWIFTITDTNVLRFSLQATTADSVTTITDTEWHNVIMVVDRSASITPYIDGEAEAPTAIAAPVMATTASPVIGARSFGGAALYFNGDIAGTFVIPRILSAAECLGLASGTGPF